MDIPLEVSFRDVERTPEIERLINKRAAQLERKCKALKSCRIAVEQPQKHQRKGNPYRVRIDMHVPPGHELVVKNKPRENPKHEGLHAVITDTFDSAERALLRQMDKMKRDTKKHPDQEPVAFVDRVFKDRGYGFIRAIDGTEYYFHQNSVLNNDFERIEPGTGVNFVPEQGEKGPQASSLKIVDKPGGHAK
jgi:cold shock CspA family protein